MAKKTKKSTKSSEEELKARFEQLGF